jgi:hypothetical protein
MCSTFVIYSKKCIISSFSIFKEVFKSIYNIFIIAQIGSVLILLYMKQINMIFLVTYVVMLFPITIFSEIRYSMFRKVMGITKHYFIGDMIYICIVIISMSTIYKVQNI